MKSFDIWQKDNTQLRMELLLEANLTVIQLLETGVWSPN